VSCAQRATGEARRVRSAQVKRLWVAASRARGASRATPGRSSTGAAVSTGVWVWATPTAACARPQSAPTWARAPSAPRRRGGVDVINHELRS